MLLETINLVITENAVFRFDRSKELDIQTLEEQKHH